MMEDGGGKSAVSCSLSSIGSFGDYFEETASACSPSKAVGVRRVEAARQVWLDSQQTGEGGRDRGCSGPLLKGTDVFFLLPLLLLTTATTLLLLCFLTQLTAKPLLFDGYYSDI